MLPTGDNTTEKQVLLLPTEASAVCCEYDCLECYCCSPPENATIIAKAPIYNANVVFNHGNRTPEDEANIRLLLAAMNKQSCWGHFCGKLSLIYCFPPLALCGYCYNGDANRDIQTIRMQLDTSTLTDTLGYGVGFILYKHGARSVAIPPINVVMTR